MGDGYVLTPEELSEQYGEQLVICDEHQAWNLVKFGIGEVWTQVDGDDGERLYLKGWHIVNRTGIYGVVFT